MKQARRVRSSPKLTLHDAKEVAKFRQCLRYLDGGYSKEDAYKKAYGDTNERAGR